MEGTGIELGVGVFGAMNLGEEGEGGEGLCWLRETGFGRCGSFATEVVV